MITSQFDGLPYETSEHFSLRSYFPRPYVHFSEKVPVNLRNVRHFYLIHIVSKLNQKV